MTTLKFDGDLAKKYRVKAGDRFFVEINVGGDIESRVCTTFGEQAFRGTFFLNVTEHDNIYGIAAAEFFETHRLSGPRRAGYILAAKKDVVIEAYQLQEAGQVEAITRNGNVELVRAGVPGMWFVRQPAGDMYLVDDEDFQARYELDKTQPEQNQAARVERGA